MRRLLPLALAWFGGCTTTAIDIFEVCELEVVLEPDIGAPGAVITARGGPYTEVRDTRIELGGFEVEVLSVDALGSSLEDLTTVCEQCDDCRAEASCGPCGSCVGELLPSSRRAECFGDLKADPVTPGLCDLCEQQVTFEVPLLGPGTTTLWMVNRNGASPQVPFTIAGSGTGSTADTGTTDTASGGSGSR